MDYQCSIDFLVSCVEQLPVAVMQFSVMHGQVLPACVGWMLMEEDDDDVL
jgi:hypothetical protein